MAIKSWASLGATAAICAAVALWSGPVQAQQTIPPAASTAERGNATGLVNQIGMLKDQNRQLLGQIEQLQHQVQQLKQISKEQYIALDTRIKKLEAAASNAPTETADQPGDKKAPAKKPVKDKPAVPASSPAPAPAPAASTSTPAHASSSASDDDNAEAQDAYGKAFDALRAGNFDASKRQFKAFVQQYPHAKLAPNAWYWLGESYYVTQDYPHALAAFEKVIKDFPDSNKASGALLKKGYSQYALHHTDAAATTLKQVVDQYSGSSAAKLATQRLQDIQLQQQLQ